MRSPHRSIRLLAVAIPLLFGSVHLCAQTNVGAVVGYEFGLPPAIDRSPGAINRRPEIEGSGTSYNHTVWLGAGLERAGMFGGGDGSLRLALGLGSGSFKSHPYDDPLELDAGGSVILPRRQMELTSLTGTLRLDAAALWGLGSGWRFGTGLWADYRFLESLVLVERSVDSIPAPDIITVGGASGTGSDFGSSPLSFGPALSLSVDIPIGTTMAIRPELSGRMNIPMLLDGAGSISGGAGLALMFDVAPAAPPLAVVPPVPPDAPPPAARNDISIDLYAGEESQRASSVAVGLRNTLHRRYLPLLPLVSYSGESVTIPERYTTLTRQESDRFTLSSLVGLSPAQVHGHMLNILGMRMCAEQAATITITASASGENDQAAAGERARRIKRYLTDVWGISESRLATSVGRADGGDRSTVRISSNLAVLFSPVVLQWIAREIAVPAIGLDPRFDEKQTRSWKIVVSQGERTLGEYGSDTRRDLSEIDLPLLLRGRRSDSTLVPLVATLTVEDMRGEKTTARDELRLHWSADTTQQGESERSAEISSYLILDPPDSMPELGITNRAMMAKIQESARTGARLTLSGFGREKPMAEKTAGEILAALERRRVQAVEIHVLGGSVVLPEEVAGNSGVDVVVEQ